jgi:hypothetical protein
MWMAMGRWLREEMLPDAMLSWFCAWFLLVNHGDALIEELGGGVFIPGDAGNSLTTGNGENAAAVAGIIPAMRGYGMQLGRVDDRVAAQFKRSNVHETNSTATHTFPARTDRRSVIHGRAGTQRIRTGGVDAAHGKEREADDYGSHGSRRSAAAAGRV